MTNSHLTYYSVLRNSNRGSVSSWRGRMGRKMGRKFKREGIYVYLWLINIEV